MTVLILGRSIPRAIASVHTSTYVGVVCGCGMSGWWSVWGWPTLVRPLLKSSRTSLLLLELIAPVISATVTRPSSRSNKTNLVQTRK